MDRTQDRIFQTETGEHGGDDEEEDVVPATKRSSWVEMFWSKVWASSLGVPDLEGYVEFAAE